MGRVEDRCPGTDQEGDVVGELLFDSGGLPDFNDFRQNVLRGAVCSTKTPECFDGLLVFALRREPSRRFGDKYPTVSRRQ
jgi:hypothetical protein